MKKLTIEEFIEKAKAIHGDKYDYSLVEYKSNALKVKIICSDHGVFEQKPNGHLTGHKCPLCSKERIKDSLRSNVEEFIQKARIVHGDKYDYSLVEYKGSALKVKIICPEHGVFEQTPNAHLRTNKDGLTCGCRHCGLKKLSAIKTSNTEEFIKKAIVTHGDKYDYSLVEYVNVETNIKITCMEHGVFEQSPHNHLGKNGCPLCAQKVKSKKLIGTKEEFIEKAKSVHEDNYDYSLVEYTGNKNKVKIICSEHGMFEQTANGHLCGNGCPKCGNTNVSSQEDFIFDNINIEAIRGNRTILDGLELDILYPKNNIAVEVDGIYWHSDIAPTPKDSKYHLDKTNECEEKGIQLLHFWDLEINEKSEIVLSVIRSKLGITENKIYARKCTIKDVNYSDSKEFLNENHMQGSGAIGSIRYGLYYADELVSLMTFGLSRFNKAYEYELIRFCNRLNTSVVGGASRLFKHSKLDSVVSYANRRWSDGGLYKTLGFEYLHTSKPNYFYFKSGKMYTRNQCQKHKLAGLLGDDFNPLETELENMDRNDYGRVYDCGNMVFGYSR